jgi:MFS family permease
VPLVNDEFHETRPPVSSLIVSIFVLGFAFGPLLLSPLSELYGRRIIFHICNVVTLACSIASAVAPNMASFIVFRFLAGSFGAGPMNIGGGSIADQIPVKKRGFVMAVFFTGMFIGPVAG